MSWIFPPDLLTSAFIYIDYPLQILKFLKNQVNVTFSNEMWLNLRNWPLTFQPCLLDTRSCLESPLLTSWLPPSWTMSCLVRSWSSASSSATARWARRGLSSPGQPTKLWRGLSSFRPIYLLSGPSTSIACAKRWVEYHVILYLHCIRHAGQFPYTFFCVSLKMWGMIHFSHSYSSARILSFGPRVNF